MFAKRRKNYRVFVITVLIIAICALVIAIMWPNAPNNDNENVNVNAQTNVEQKEEKISKTEQDASPNYTEDDTTSTNRSYYIVKKYGEGISVFFVTEEGEHIKLEDTDILYDLLPLEDQINFDRGIILEGQEQLSSLLQDFEG